MLLRGETRKIYDEPLIPGDKQIKHIPIFIRGGEEGISEGGGILHLVILGGEDKLILLEGKPADAIKAFGLSHRDPGEDQISEQDGNVTNQGNQRA